MVRSERLHTLRILLCTILTLSNAMVQNNYLRKSYPASVLADAKLDTEQLISKYNYPAETHFTTTEDGYILRLHRISRPGARPVLLMHGLLDSSATWVMMGPWSGLGYLLYDKGYDVWMGNVRGTFYSRNHTKYDPDLDMDYWSFSWHEIGYYDLPAMVDYVLRETGSSKLGYFGHSQGTTAFWVMCSMRPEYNKNITMMHALAPVAFFRAPQIPYWDMARHFIEISKGVLREFLPRSYVPLSTCFSSNLTENMCLELIWKALGKEEKQMNMTMLPVMFGHLPNGCSFKQFEHFAQLIESGCFCQYDFGSNENLKRYGKIHPPGYPLDRISAPVGLYYTKNDNLASVSDVQYLAELLPNVVEKTLYPDSQWNHVTMLWGIDAREVAHRRMLNVMLEYE